MAKYEKLSEKITSKKLQELVNGGNLLPYDPGADFPVWVWPYIHRAFKAGKLKLNARGKLTVPKNADIDDYPLPVIGFIKQAGIDFPGVEIAELPADYFSQLKAAMDSKVMDQYGKVDPENLHKVPRPLWPYVRVKGRLGTILSKVGKYDPENTRDFPPGLIPRI